MTIALALALWFAFDAEALLEATSRYVEQHRREFRQYIADEHEVQKFYDQSGKLRQTREIQAECYVVTVPERPDRTYEFREILKVNGRKRLRDEEFLTSLLARKGGRFEEEYLRLREESNRYNLFSGRGFLSNVALALLEYAGIPARRHAHYRLSGRAGEHYVVEFQEANRATLRTGGGMYEQPLAVRGQMQVSSDGTVRSVEAALSVEREDGATRIRYAVEYGPGPDGLQAPVRKVISVHRADWWNELVAESVSTFSGYRRLQQN